jgi:hypothetical protein
MYSCSPAADDSEVVLNALVVDVRSLLQKRHGDLRVADALGSGGHAGGQPPHCVRGAMGEVEHRARRRGRRRARVRMEEGRKAFGVGRAQRAVMESLAAVP